MPEIDDLEGAILCVNGGLFPRLQPVPRDGPAVAWSTACLVCGKIVAIRDHDLVDHTATREEWTRWLRDQLRCRCGHD